jgi:hypothetical protein
MLQKFVFCSRKKLDDAKNNFVRQKIIKRHNFFLGDAFYKILTIKIYKPVVIFDFAIDKDSCLKNQH